MTNVKSARTGLIALAGALALLGGAVQAQTTEPTKRPAQQPPVSATPTPAAPVAKPAPNPLVMEDVSKVTGAVVYGSDDKRIGSVSTLLMKPESKTIDRLVVSDGGILGIGRHLVALPVQEFQWDAQRAVFRVAITADDLKNMPAWKEQVSEASASSPTQLNRAEPSAGAKPPLAVAPPAKPAPAQ